MHDNTQGKSEQRRILSRQQGVKRKTVRSVTCSADSLISSMASASFCSTPSPCQPRKKGKFLALVLLESLRLRNAETPKELIV